MPLEHMVVIYDTRFRQLAAHSPATIWRQLHAPLYASTILAMDQSLANRSLRCLKPNHSTAACALCLLQKASELQDGNNSRHDAFGREGTKSTAQRFRKIRFVGGSTGVPVTEVVAQTGMFACAAAVGV